MRLEAGLQLAGRYTILEELSVGPFWSSYIGFQDIVDRRVLVKCLRVDPLGIAPQEASALFRAEVLQCSQLRHPNTSSVFDFGLTKSGILYLIIENSDGELLRDVLERERRLSIEETVRVVGQTVCSVAEAHALGLVHGNLGLDSIALCQHFGETRFVRVTGYGLSGFVRRLAGPRADLPSYVSPEWGKSGPLKPTTDVYALGLLMYEMLTGRKPPQGKGHSPLPTQHLPKQLAGTHLIKLLFRMTHRDPGVRPADGSSLLAALKTARQQDKPNKTKALSSSAPSSVAIPQPPSSTARPVHRSQSSTPPESEDGAVTQPSLEMLTPHNGDVTRPATSPRTKNTSRKLYGRHEEQRLLVDLFRELRRAERGCVLVMNGASGAGKSALMTWFGAAIRRGGGTALGYGTCEGGPHKTPVGLADAFAESLGFPRLPGMRHKVTRIRGALEEILGAELTERQVLVLLSLFGWAVRPFESWEAATAASLICEVARKRPMLLQIDSVELAGTWTQAVLDRLARRLAASPAPLMVVCGLGERGDLPQRRRNIPLLSYTNLFQMSLGPLVAAHQRVMIHDLFRDSGLGKPSPNLEMLIVHYCEGNPGFIREQVTFVLGHSALQNTPMGLELSEDVTFGALLPPRIEAAMGRQLEGLLTVHDERQALLFVLGRMAILGRSTTEEALRRLLRLEADEGSEAARQALGAFEMLMLLLREDGLIRALKPALGSKGESWGVFQAPMWRYLLKVTEHSPEGPKLKELVQRVTNGEGL